MSTSAPRSEARRRAGAGEGSFEPGPALRLPGVYEGRVWHGRTGAAAHEFDYRLSMVLLDTADPGAVLGGHPLWSARPGRPGLKSFRRADYLEDPDGGVDVPLDEAVRRTVERATGSRPGGPVLLLTQLRTAGVQFNPISVYYCYGSSGEAVEAAVLEVTNTPWHERHAYVVGPPGEHRFDKAFHVSPFFPMDQAYRVSYGEPGEAISVGFDVEQSGEVKMRARLSLARRGSSRSDLSHAMWHYPAGTMATSAAIYREAFRLWRKGAVFHPHPSKAGGPKEEVTRR